MADTNVILSYPVIIKNLFKLVKRGRKGNWNNAVK